MKKKYIYKGFLSLACFLTVGLTSSWEDFLTVLATNAITEEDYFKEKGDLDNVRAAAYYKLSTADVVGRLLYWGEIRSDNMNLNQMSASDIMYVRDGVLQPTEAMFDWSSYYTGINYCNKVLEKGQFMVDKAVDPSFNESDWRPMKAEMVGLRALYYFNLVKAYRNVPYVEKSISTDAEAKKSKIPATKGADLLGSLIEQLEKNKDFAATNYGSSRDNKGRITKRSIRALLADIYLWRGCLLAHSNAKGDSITRADSIMNICFTKAVEHCDYILNDMMAEYKRVQDANANSMGNSNIQYSEDYPLIMFKPAVQNVADQIYLEIWGQGNSSESIFDIQYDGTNYRNTSIANYFSSFSTSGGLTASKLTVNPTLLASMSTVNPEVGYGKTDLRLLETVKYDETKTTYPYHKGIATYIIVKNPEDMTEGFSGTPSYRESGKSDMCQPVYRLSDVMLIKAEALARKHVSKGDDKVNGSNNEEVKEGFKLVNQLFARYNPKLVKTGSGSADFICTRLDDNYADSKTPADLLTLVYQERQREFVGEGKRWFDLTREAEFQNSTKSVLALMSASASLQTRLRQLWSMYVPIYSEELKVNDKLVQNPVWDKYSEN